MKTLRFAVAAVAVLGCVSAFATNARVESMGKSSNFIMDDISIFDNPANINLYPNFLIGELGHYDGVRVEQGQNMDPIDPWFGGIFSLNIGSDRSLSIAGVLNRKDERLLKYFPNCITESKTPGDRTCISVPSPVTNFDGFLGANFSNMAFGLHVYVAHQDGIGDDGIISEKSFASALQVDAGTNIEISGNYAIEFSFGSARIQYGPNSRDFLDPHLFSVFGKARLFSKVDAINGHLIPIASFSNMRAPGRSELEAGLGMGVDAAFDRGFFWLGLRGFYNKQRTGANWEKGYDETTGVTKTYFHDIKDDNWGETVGKGGMTNLWQFGGTINFGIERNIWWDWFVIRVGGQKTITYADYSTGDNIYSVLCPSTEPCRIDGNYFVTNPTSDGTKNDNVGFGFGINIEEKLKIDASVAEDVIYRNPFVGGGRLMSRVSATYSF